MLLAVLLVVGTVLYATTDRPINAASSVYAGSRGAVRAGYAAGRQKRDSRRRGNLRAVPSPRPSGDAPRRRRRRSGARPTTPRRGRSTPPPPPPRRRSHAWQDTKRFARGAVTACQVAWASARAIPDAFRVAYREARNQADAPQLESTSTQPAASAPGAQVITQEGKPVTTPTTDIPTVDVGEFDSPKTMDETLEDLARAAEVLKRINEAFVDSILDFAGSYGSAPFKTTGITATVAALVETIDDSEVNLQAFIEAAPHCHEALEEAMVLGEHIQQVEAEGDTESYQGA